MSINQVQEEENEAQGRIRKTLTLSTEAIEVGERLAKDENRNFSNYIETLILADAGKLPVIAKGEGVAA